MRYIKIFFCFLSFTALAEDQVVRIAIGDFPPFEFYENGQVEGINIQTIKDVFTRAGYTVEFYPLPWKRALMLAETGEMDALASIPKYTYNESLFIFSKPIMYTQNYLFKNKSLVINPKDYNELKSYNIGVIDKYFYYEKFINDSSLQFSPINVYSTPDVSNLKRLSDGRIDLVACSIHVCKYWLNKYSNLFNQIDFLTSVTVDNGHTLHVAFSKKDSARSQEIATKFNEELAKYIAEGNIEKNIAKYPNSGFDVNEFDQRKLN